MAVVAVVAVAVVLVAVVVGHVPRQSFGMNRIRRALRILRSAPLLLLYLHQHHHRHHPQQPQSQPAQKRLTDTTLATVPSRARIQFHGFAFPRQPVQGPNPHNVNLAARLQAKLWFCRQVLGVT